MKVDIYFRSKNGNMKLLYLLTSLMVALSLVISCAKEEGHSKGDNTQKITYSNPAHSSQPPSGGSHSGKPNHSNNPAPPSHNGVSANCNSCHKGMMKDVNIRKDEIFGQHQPSYNLTVRFSEKDKVE
jgi:hypothetical protein